VVPFEETRIALPDGYETYGRWWMPPAPRGAVLYHHGIQSHCGWYEQSARRLCDAGFVVLQVDRRGSGRNEVARGHAESADQLLDDARTAGEELRRLSRFSGNHVVGISWGGKLAVAAHVVEPQYTRSLTLVTPGLFPRIGVSKAEMARIGFAMLYEPTKPFDIPLNDAELFTTRPDWKHFIDTDPLCLRQCTAGFYLASRRMDKIVARFPQAPAVATHLLLAGDERIIDNDATADFIRSLCRPQTRISWYPKARHSLEFEGDPEEYFGDLIGFIDRG